jgi:glycosyltransferase 2 family protein
MLKFFEVNVLKSVLKILLPWVILLVTGWFLGQTLLEHWQQVQTLKLQPQAWGMVLLALVVATLAHIWSGLVWGEILHCVQQPQPKRWVLFIALRNAPTKYIPGGIWDMYARIVSAQKRGLQTPRVTVSVILEPMFLIAGAFLLSLLTQTHLPWKLLGLGLFLPALHPFFFNWGWQTAQNWQVRLGQLKLSTALPKWVEDKAKGEAESTTAQATQASEAGGSVSQTLSQATLMTPGRYPFLILAGATLFILLRGLAFLLVLRAFTPLIWQQVLPSLGEFSLAWCLTLFTPVPVGIGVFETGILQFLADVFPTSLLLGTMAVYRLLLVLADLIGVGIAYLLPTANLEPSSSELSTSA